MVSNIFHLEQLLRFASILPEAHLRVSTWFELYSTLDLERDRLEELLAEKWGRGYEHILQKDDFIHLIEMTQRLPRLAEGTYNVRVPAATIVNESGEFDISEVTIEVEHKRAHHKHAQFDLSEYEKAAAGLPTELGIIWSKPNQPDSITNFELTTESFTSTYSLFFAKIPKPPRWEQLMANVQELQSEFEKIVTAREKILLHTPESDLDLEGILEPETRFYLEHKATLQFLELAQYAVKHQAITAMNRIREEYSDIVAGYLIPQQFKNVTRVLFDGNMSLGCTVTREEDLSPYQHINASGYYGFERLPFNERFHNMLREQLTTTETKAMYLGKAQQPLEIAYYILLHGPPNLYCVAITEAAKAFETTLRGYITEMGLISEEGKGIGADKRTHFNVHQLTSSMFDKAVLKEANEKGYDLQGKEHDFFDPYLRDQLFTPNGLGISLNKTRNKIIHGQEGVTRNPDWITAALAVSVYTDAINFIGNKEWLAGKPKKISRSDLLRLYNTESQDTPFSPSKLIEEMQFEYAKVLSYLHPLERAIHARDVPSTSWAFQLQNKA